jgi:lipoate-protein ligase A
MTSSKKTDQWRLIHNPPASGSWNMAVDEALLESVQSGDSPPTLRLYDWVPATLTLGYAQPIHNVDLENLKRKGWGLVRRPTGGRAILHVDEITYSVVASTSEKRVAGGVLESYKRLAQALLKSVELLDVPAIGQEKSGERKKREEPNPICFEAPSDYEITVDGKKLLGSAQARRKEGVLQHGSLPLYGDIARITDALSFSDDDKRERAAKRVRESAATVEGAIGRKILWEEAASAFAKGFSEALELEFIQGELTSKEIEAAKKWEESKYASEEWLNRV